MRFVVTFVFDDTAEKRKMIFLASDLVEAEHWAKAQLKMWKRTAEFDIELENESKL